MFETNDGTTLRYDDMGDGAPLLLLHGLTGTRADWQHAFDREALGRRFRVLAPDARSHGQSTNPTGAFGFRRCAEDVLALLDHLGIAKVSAVGASLGAKTLLHVATLAPERVEAMVLVSATPRLPEAMRPLFLEAVEKLPARFTGDAKDLAFSTADLARITARTLVVAGDRDPLYPVELAIELYRGIPNAALYVVPNGGHCPIYEGERDAFAARALSFL